MAAALGGQLRVAALEGRGGHVQAVSEEFVVSRCAFGAAQRYAAMPALCSANARSQRQASWRKAARAGGAEVRLGSVWCIACRGHAHLLSAQAGAEHQRPRVPLFQRKERGRLRLRVGHESLCTQRREIQRLGLYAEDAVQRPQRRVAQLQAQVVALAAKGGADHATGADLLMFIAGVAGLRRDLRDRPLQRAPLASHGHAVALHADEHIGLSRGAVAVAHGLDRGAQKALLRHPACTHRAAFAARC